MLPDMICIGIILFFVCAMAVSDKDSQFKEGQKIMDDFFNDLHQRMKFKDHVNPYMLSESQHRALVSLVIPVREAVDRLNKGLK